LTVTGLKILTQSELLDFVAIIVFMVKRPVVNVHQLQTSSRNINTLSREKVMRINKMITKGNLL